MGVVSAILLGISFAIPFGATSSLLVNIAVSDSLGKAMKYALGVILATAVVAGAVLLGDGAILSLISRKFLLFIAACILFYAAYRGVVITRSAKQVSQPVLFGFGISIASFFDWSWWIAVFGAFSLGMPLAESASAAAIVILVRLAWLSALALLASKTAEFAGKKVQRALALASSATVALFALYFLYLSLAA